MNYLDLFSGIGGFPYGMHLAGIYNKDKGGPRKTSGTGGNLAFGGSSLGRTKRTYRKNKNRVVSKKR